MSDYIVEQKLLLIKKLQDDFLKEKELSQKNKDLIDYFYKWCSELGFHGVLREFNKIK